MASVSVTPMPSSVCKNRQLDQPGVRISPFVPLRLSFVLTIIALSVTSFAGRQRRTVDLFGFGHIFRNPFVTSPVGYPMRSTGPETRGLHATPRTAAPPLDLC